MKGTYGFIGCGNMGGALVRAAAAAVSPNQIFIANRGRAKAETLATETGAIISDNRSIAAECEFIFLGVKPQGMADMLADIRDVLAARRDRFVLVSMAAGKTIRTIRSLSIDCPVIRIMPNLPVSVGKGVTLVCSEDTTPEEMEHFTAVMRHAGELVDVKESLFDAGCAVSGCGPAFVFMFIDALTEGGVRCGLDRDVATKLAANTLIGSASLLMQSGRQPSDLCRAVCSPGGATIEGVHTLEAGNMPDHVAAAVVSACNRSKEL